MELTDLLHSGNIFVELDADTKFEAIRELIDRSTIISEMKDYIYDRVLEREELEPTAVGNGIGIAHAKVDTIEKIEVVMGLLKNGIDYESYDDTPVKVLFVVVAPIAQNREYLNLMAKISRVCRHSENVNKILQLANGDEIFEFLKSLNR